MDEESPPNSALSGADSRFAGHFVPSHPERTKDRDGKGESRPESALSGQVAGLSPLCLLQSRISPAAACGVSWSPWPGRNFHVHLVSDSTGETVSSVARACLVQYEGIFVQEHVWSLVRTKGQMEKVMQEVERNRGPVLYTLVDPDLRDLVRDQLPAAAAPLRRRARPGDERAGPAFPFQERAVAGPPASARRGLFRPHRRHALHAGARRRAVDARSRGRRRDPGRAVAHLEDADLRLSRQSRRARGQRAAGAGSAAAGRARDVDAAADRRADHRSRTAGADPRQSPAPAAARHRERIYRHGARCSARSRTRAGSMPARNGRPSTSRGARSRRRRRRSSRCCRSAREQRQAAQ